MTMTRTLSWITVGALFFFATGCDKLGLGKETAPAEATTAEAPVVPPPEQAAAGLADGEVATYANMTPASGTRVLNQGFTVYQAADRTSKVLGSLSTGTWVNLKGTLANWIMIDWPSGVGQLSPGWIEATTNDRRFNTTPDAGIGDAGGFVPAPVIDAGPVPTATTTAPAADAGRVRIRIPTAN